MGGSGRKPEPSEPAMVIPISESGEVMPQELSAPGAELDFSAGARLDKTAVVRQRSTANAVGPAIQVSSDPDSVMPQELTSPGAQPDFSAPTPTGFPTQPGAAPPTAILGGANLPDIERLHALQEGAVFWRRVAIAAGGVALVLGCLGLVIGFAAGRSRSGPARSIARKTGELEAPATTKAAALPGAAAVAAPATVVPPLVRPVRNDFAEPVAEVDPPLSAVAPSAAEDPGARGRAKRQKGVRPPGRSAPDHALASPSPPAPEPPAAPAKKQARLEQLLAKLRASPGDADLFEQLRDGIAQQTQSLPPERQQRINSDLHRAERSFDVELLAKALEKL